MINELISCSLIRARRRRGRPLRHRRRAVKPPTRRGGGGPGIRLSVKAVPPPVMTGPVGLCRRRYVAGPSVLSGIFQRGQRATGRREADDGAEAEAETERLPGCRTCHCCEETEAEAEAVDVEAAEAQAEFARGESSQPSPLKDCGSLSLFLSRTHSPAFMPGVKAFSSGVAAGEARMRGGGGGATVLRRLWCGDRKTKERRDGR